ncbi:MAG: elongation factor G [Deinococcales bacterium]
MRVRNVAVVGHNACGKTTLVEALLFKGGVKERLGKVEDGTTASDYTEAEKRRGISISTSVLNLPWKETHFNLLDAPGYADFVGEIRGALRAADSALVVVNATAGVAVGTERVWNTAEEFSMPRVVAITKLDREHASFFGTLASIQDTLSAHAVAVSIPIGTENNFRGVIDLLSDRAYIYQEGKLEIAAIPEALVESARAQRTKLLEAIVETNEALLELYLADEPIEDSQLRQAFFDAVHRAEIFPVVPVSGVGLVGLEPLLELMAEALRAPEERRPVRGIDGSERECSINAPLSARVWRVSIDPFVGKVAYVRVWSGKMSAGDAVHNSHSDKDFKPAHVYTLVGKELREVPVLEAGMIGAITKVPDVHTGDTLCDPAHPIDFGELELPEPITSIAIHAATRADEDKLGAAIGKLLEEDPTLHLTRNSETAESVLEGMGHTHLEVAIEKLSIMGVQVQSSTPKIAYRETVRSVASAQGKHKKQSGGHGQYGDCWLRLEPFEQEFMFTSEVVGGVIPTKYIPSVEKGVEEARHHGVLAGFLVQNIKAVVYDGSYHDVDSSDIAFKQAGILAFKAAMEKAKPCLLEPVMLLRVRVPERYTGEILGDLNSRRARVQGMDPDGAVTVISALVPLVEVQNYSPDLHSLTGGRGIYSLKFDHYADVPPAQAEKIIASRRLEMHA